MPTPTVFVVDPLDPARAAGAAVADAGAGAGATISAVPGSIDPQCLHLMAASWISSAQYGHVFTSRLYPFGRRVIGVSDHAPGKPDHPGKFVDRGP